MSKSEIKELDAESFEKLTSRCEELVVVMFFTNSCQNCKAMMPIYRKVAEELKGVAQLAMVNAQLHQEIAMTYGVRSVPTFKFFCHGHPTGEIVGGVNKTILRNTIKDFASYRHQCVSKSSKVIYEMTGYA
jgi:thioredoxin-like negative regulator of GroEL